MSVFTLDNLNNFNCGEVIERDCFIDSDYPPILDYKFDNTTILNDISGNGNNGEAFNLTLSSDTNKWETSGVFNGNTTYIEIPTSINSLIDGKHSFTILAGVKFDTVLTRDIILGNCLLTGASNINFEKTATGALRIYWNWTPDYYSNVCITSNTEFYDIGFQYNIDTKQMKMFCNGVEVFSILYTLDQTSSVPKYRIGGDSRLNQGVMLGGKMSYFKIYPSAIPLDIIKKMYGTENFNNNGQLISNEFVEDDRLNCLITKNTIYTNLKEE